MKLHYFLQVLLVAILTLTVALVLFFFCIFPLAVQFISIRQMGSFPTCGPKGCLLIANHPTVPWDCLIMHIWLRKRNLQIPVHFIISAPYCYFHDYFLTFSSGTQIKTLPVFKKSNTTGRISDALERGEYVLAFLSPSNPGTGLGHALRKTAAKCYGVKMHKNNIRMVSIDQIKYDVRMDAKELTKQIQDFVNPIDDD